MTPEEKEIRAAERKAMAEVRSWKRKVHKELEGMTQEERMEYWKKQADRLRAEGINVISKEELFRKQAEELKAEGFNVVSGVN